jgi:hypothetical protein
MDDDRLSVIEAANRLGKHTSTVYKMLNRIGVTPNKERHRNRGNVDCVASGCERLHTEVFRADSLASVTEKCNQFFAIMPEIEERDL